MTQKMNYLIGFIFLVEINFNLAHVEIQRNKIPIMPRVKPKSKTASHKRKHSK